MFLILFNLLFQPLTKFERTTRMKILKYPLLIVLGLLIGCSESSVVDPASDSASFENEITSDLSKYGNQKIIKVFPAVKSITIDGEENDWARAPKHKMRLEVDPGTGSPIENKDDLTSYFKMLWDEDNLYVFARIQDQDINTDGTELYERDGFEVYIDGDNSKTAAIVSPPVVFPPPAYDINDDFFRFIPGEASAFSAWGLIDPSNFEFAIMSTDEGYNVEIKMPFAELPGFPAVDKMGHEFGLEFQTNDNDYGNRESFLKWNSGLDDSYFNPSIFGTAVLVK